MDYLTFRANALANLAMAKNKRDYRTKTDIEYWIEQEYNRHYGEDSVMEVDTFCGICGEGVLHGYKTTCDACKAKAECAHDWEEFKSDGYKVDLQVCRKCGERRTV